MRPFLAVVLALGVLLVAIGWRLVAVPRESRLTLFVSGDTRGYLEPCGCRRDQAGGLPARLTLMRLHDGPGRVLFDVGNLTGGDRSYELLKLDYLLQAMREMGYAAVNLGANEASLDRTTLQGYLRRETVPFVSCNVLDRRSGQPLAAPFRTVNVAGVTIGVTGVAEADADAIGPGVRLSAPTEALANLLPGLRRRCDLLVVLAHVRGDTLRQIAERFQEVDCLLGGDVPQSSASAEVINRAVCFNVTDRGKVIGRLEYVRRTDGLHLARAEALKTRDTLTPAPEMARLLDRYRDALRQRSLTAASEEGLQSFAAASNADTYTGESGCRPCHAGACRTLDRSAHSRALATLVSRRNQYDPDCLRCHVVGYGARDGYLSAARTPALAGVQCENCHGRGAYHIRDRRSGRPAASTLRPVTPATCTRCHDAENSDRFEYESYWAKIRHGRG